MHDNDPEVRLLVTVPDSLQHLITADSGARETKEYDR